MAPGDARVAPRRRRVCAAARVGQLAMRGGLKARERAAQSDKRRNRRAGKAQSDELPNLQRRPGLEGDQPLRNELAMWARSRRSRAVSAAERGAEADLSAGNHWTALITKAAIILITFFSNGNFQDKIVPDSANSSLQQYIVVVMWIVIGVTSYFRRPILRIDLTAGFLANFALYALALVSISWSYNPVESVTKGAAMCFVIFGAYRLVKTIPFDEIVECIIHGLFLLNASSVFLALFVPDIGILANWQHAGQWNGIFFSKQTLGICGALLLFFSSYRLLNPPRRIYHGVAAAMALACVIGSESRGGGAVAVLAVACIYLTGASMRFARILAFFPFVASLFGAALIVYFVRTGNLYLTIFDTDIDFTERTFIWQYALSHFKNAPLLGYGLNGFWTLKDVKDVFVEQHGWFLDNYHDGYIAIVMETGVIGFCIFVAGYFLYGLRIVREIRDRGALDRNVALTLVYCCLIFFIDFTETFFLRSTNITSSLLTICIFIAFSQSRLAPKTLVGTVAAPVRLWREGEISTMRRGWRREVSLAPIGRKGAAS
jgi:exopolysaccharide production protein ExoQ